MTARLFAASAIFAISCASGSAHAQDMRDIPFLCGDGRIITVNFADESARVSMDFSLDQQPSGSGFVYGGPAGTISGQGQMITWEPSGTGSVSCSAVPGGAALVGATWQLAHMVSDGKEPVAATDPTRHTLTFMADGRLLLRAQCNRGQGTWQATPEEPDQGRLELGPVALTRKACASDPFPQMAIDLGQAVVYRVNGDELQLQSDTGASYVFRTAD